MIVLSFICANLFDCFPGETKTTVSPYIHGGVSDGQWHVVEVHYYNKVRPLTLLYYFFSLQKSNNHTFFCQYFLPLFLNT